MRRERLASGMGPAACGTNSAGTANPGLGGACPTERAKSPRIRRRPTAGSPRQPLSTRGVRTNGSPSPTRPASARKVDRKERRRHAGRERLEVVAPPHPVPAELRVEAAAQVEREAGVGDAVAVRLLPGPRRVREQRAVERSEEHTSELQSRFGISYAVFCLKKKK